MGRSSEEGVLKPRLSAEWELAKQGEEKECSRLKDQQVQRPVLGRQLGVVRGEGSLWCREGGSGKWLEWRPVRETVVGLLDPLMNSHGPQSCLHLALTCLLLAQKHQDLPFTSTDPRVSVKGSSLSLASSQDICPAIFCGQMTSSTKASSWLMSIPYAESQPKAGDGTFRALTRELTSLHIACKSAQVG